MLNTYKLEQYIATQMQAAQVPGVALAIIADQHVVYARGFGVTSVEAGGVPVTPHTRFLIASVTKPLTATLIMRLVEQGFLDLNTPATTYLPWLSFSDPHARQQITIRMLLNHTSGLSNPFAVHGRRDANGLAAYVRDDLPHLPLVAPPGMVYAYYNANYNLLGYLAEVVTGKPFTHVMQELVFDPLDMQHTTFDRLVALTYPCALAHYLDETQTLQVDHQFPDNTAHYPAGYAISSVLDLANFASMHLGHGRFKNHQILRPESVTAMHRLEADAYTPVQSGYGLGFVTGIYKHLSYVCHSGGLSAFNTLLFLVPLHDVAVIMMTNRRTDDFVLLDLVYKLVNDMLDLPVIDVSIVPDQPTSDHARWSLYTGTFVGEYVGLAEIRTHNGALLLDLNGEIVPLAMAREQVYVGHMARKTAPVAVGFVPDGTNPVPYIMVNSEPCRRIVLSQVPPLQKDVLIRYAGTFGFDIHDEHPILVDVVDDQLHIGWAGNQALATALDQTHFVCKHGVFTFVVEADGTVPTINLPGDIPHLRLDEPV